jgi:hypothetical protein
LILVRTRFDSGLFAVFPPKSDFFNTLLGKVFRDAGLPWPNMSSFQKASCGPDGFYWLFAETVRTLLPNILRLGLATAEEVGIDSLESRLCEEATSSRLTAFSPRWVSAWVRAPLE